MVMEDLSQYKKALCIVFAIHVLMFVVSFWAAIMGRSSAVMADAIDFIGDATSYILSMYLLTKPIRMRAVISIAKAVTMTMFSLIVIVYTVIKVRDGITPDYEVMGMSGVLGIISHIVCAYFLFKFKDGDSNRVSVWVCTLNDLFSNVLTVSAAYFVMLTNSIIPDVIAALLIVSISIRGAILIFTQAKKDMRYIR